MPIAPDPDAYVVNVGDMLSIWTKNTYKSNMHRVVNRSGTDRYSVPFFFDGNIDTKLAPLDGSELPDSRIITAGEHMLERLGTTYGRAKQPKAVGIAS